MIERASSDLTLARLFAHRLVPCVLIAAGVGLVAVAPAERMLGAGIRWVYPHVGLVWAQAIQWTFAASFAIAAALTTWTTVALRSAAVAAREQRPSPAHAA